MRVNLPIANATLPTEGMRSYLFPRSATHAHRGVDLPAPKGTLVRAVTSGEVTHASSTWAQGFTGYGRHVVIRGDDGVHTLYAHLDAVSVARGDVVFQGEAIGTVGNSLFTKAGNYTDERGGYHLHFETSDTAYPKDSEAPRIDPVKYMASIADTARDGLRNAPGPLAVQASPFCVQCPSCGGLLELSAAPKPKGET